MNLWGGVVVGGRAHSGEVGGRAVLFVPLDGLWELHELPWEAPDDECEDSYWEDDATTAETVLRWDIDWIEPSHMRQFIVDHFGDLDADLVMRRSA